MLAAVQPNFQPIASQSQAEYEFGQFLYFSLSAQADEPISAVTLFYRSPELPFTFTLAIPVEPDQDIFVDYKDDLNQFKPAPFTTISYWWQVSDSAGNVFDIPPQLLAYDDNRFDWQQLSGNRVTVHWTKEETALGQLALDIVNESLPQQQAVNPVSLPDPLRIYIYPSTSDLQSSLRLAGRDWVGGHTNPELGVILVTAANARTAAVDLRQSIPHELAHLMLYQAIGPAYERVPQWFNEGLAAIMEANPDPNEQLILEEAIGAGTTVPFAQLCAGFPADGRQAVLAYAQSASLMHFIQTDYGNRVLNQMILALADGADCESIVTRVLGISLTQLNQKWLQSVNPKPSLVVFFENSGI